MVKKRIEELTMNDMKPITISFREEPEEFELYLWILQQSVRTGKSGYIKDQLWELKKVSENKSGIEKGQKPIPSQSQQLIDMDF